MGTLVTAEELKQHTLAFLKKERVMVIGTSAKDQVWSATVEYVVIDGFELIFYSRPDSRHAENISKNENVSVVITEMPPKKTGNKSVQIAGVARIAQGAEWNAYYPLYAKKIKNADKQPDHIIYVVKPTELWILDEKLLGHQNRVKVTL